MPEAEFTPESLPAKSAFEGFAPEEPEPVFSFVFAVAPLSTEGPIVLDAADFDYGGHSSEYSGYGDSRLLSAEPVERDAILFGGEYAAGGWVGDFYYEGAEFHTVEQLNGLVVEVGNSLEGMLDGVMPQDAAGSANAPAQAYLEVEGITSLTNMAEMADALGIAVSNRHVSLDAGHWVAAPAEDQIIRGENFVESRHINGDGMTDATLLVQKALLETGNG